MIFVFEMQHHIIIYENAKIIWSLSQLSGAISAPHFKK